MDVFLQAKNLNKIFDTGSTKVHVLKDVNVSIPKYKFTIITGPSGCGKSTLLHVLLGLEIPTEGKVFLNGNDLYKLDPDKRASLRSREIGIIQQQSNWIKSLNVIENVSIPAQLVGCSQEESLSKAAKSLGVVGMGQWSEASPVELSSGQQQKVALARALVNDAPVLVMDEPTGNLDRSSSDALMGLVSVLVSSRSFTVIMVTHDLRFKEYAHNLIEMIDGKIV